MFNPEKIQCTSKKETPVETFLTQLLTLPPAEERVSIAETIKEYFEMNFIDKNQTQEWEYFFSNFFPRYIHQIKNRDLGAMRYFVLAVRNFEAFCQGKIDKYIRPTPDQINRIKIGNDFAEESKNKVEESDQQEKKRIADPEEIKRQIEQALEAGQPHKETAQNLVKEMKNEEMQNAIVWALIVEIDNRKTKEMREVKEFSLAPSRLEFVNYIIEALQVGNMTIQCPREGGKTKVLNALERKLQEDNNYTIEYFSLDGVKEDIFFQIIADRLTEKLKDKISPRILDKITSSPANDAVSKLSYLINDFCDSFPDKKILLLLDEAEQLTEEYSQEFQQYFRSFLSRFSGRVKVILAGRNLFTSQWQKKTSPLDNAFSKKFIPPFSEKEAKEVLKQEAPSINQDEVDVILDRLKEEQAKDFEHRQKQYLEKSIRLRSKEEINPSMLDKLEKASSFLFPGPLKKLLKDPHADISEYRQPE